MTSFDIPYRFRRLRQNNAFRDLVRQTKVTTDDLIFPIFVEEEIDNPIEISAMPGVFRYPETMLADRVKEISSAGIKAIMLFGVSHYKDAEGSQAWLEDGLLSRMIRIAKEAAPEMLVIADTCFCEYTDHGHCGVIDGNDVDNDLTLENLQRQSVASAKAGADIIAPSGMMDGTVAALRDGLDEAGFTNVPIMSYSTKFASAFYGPFREAAGCELKGDRKGLPNGFCKWQRGFG